MGIYLSPTNLDWIIVCCVGIVEICLLEPTFFPGLGVASPWQKAELGITERFLLVIHHNYDNLQISNRPVDGSMFEIFLSGLFRHEKISKYPQPKFDDNKMSWFCRVWTIKHYFASLWRWFFSLSEFYHHFKKNLWNWLSMSWWLIILIQDGKISEYLATIVHKLNLFSV